MGIVCAILSTVYKAANIAMSAICRVVIRMFLRTPLCKIFHRVVTFYTSTIKNFPKAEKTAYSVLLAKEG